MKITTSFCLVEKYHRQLLNFIYRMVRDERIVEDIGQEVFLSVYKSMKNFDLSRDTPFSAWLFITARNRCLSELRGKRSASVSLEEAADVAARGKSPEEAAIDGEELEAVRAALEELPEPYKSAIINSLRGDSEEEIALKEGITLGTVKSRLFRARGKMRRMLFERFRGKGYEKV